MVTLRKILIVHHAYVSLEQFLGLRSAQTCGPGWKTNNRLPFIAINNQSQPGSTAPACISSIHSRAATTRWNIQGLDTMGIEHGIQLRRQSARLLRPAFQTCLCSHTLICRAQMRRMLVFILWKKDNSFYITQKSYFANGSLASSISEERLVCNVPFKPSSAMLSVPNSLLLFPRMPNERLL